MIGMQTLIRLYICFVVKKTYCKPHGPIYYLFLIYFLFILLHIKCIYKTEIAFYNDNARRNCAANFYKVRENKEFGYHLFEVKIIS